MGAQEASVTDRWAETGEGRPSRRDRQHLNKDAWTEGTEGKRKPENETNRRSLE